MERAKQLIRKYVSKDMIPHCGWLLRSTSLQLIQSDLLFKIPTRSNTRLSSS